MAPARKTIRKKTEEDPSSPHLLTSHRKPFILLHICCGPCSTHVIDLLRDTYHPIGFFYNPNLYPKEEYFRRLEAAARVSRQGRIALWVPPFVEESWRDCVRGLEGEPEELGQPPEFYEEEDDDDDESDYVPPYSLVAQLLQEDNVVGRDRLRDATGQGAAGVLLRRGCRCSR